MRSENSMATEAMLNTAKHTHTPIINDTSDAELVAWAATGDAQAFEIIMRRHNQLLFRTARGILKNDQTAEDALQDAYLKAWQALGGFRADAKLSTWLVRIVINEALGRLRSKGAEIIPLETAMIMPDPEIQATLTADARETPEHQTQRAQLRVILESKIDMLPDAFRTVFILRAVEEMTVSEVAQALEIPEATVRTRFFRARSLLRTSLSNAVDTALLDTFSFDGARCDRIVAGVLARAGSLP